MATRQTNRRNTGKKTTRKNSKSASKGLFLGIGLIAVLIALIAYSVMGLNNSSKDKQEEPTITYIPAKKKEDTEKDTSKVVSVPKKEDKSKEKKELEKREQALKDKEKELEEEKRLAQLEKERLLSQGKDNTAALIRLVIYDHEISRTSVDERTGKNSSGNKVTYFDITCDENIHQSLSSAISSILRKKGYKVKADEKQIFAISRQDEYSIVLKSPVKEKKVIETTEIETKKEEITKLEKDKNAEGKKQDTGKYPPLPPYSKKQVKFAVLLDDGGHNLELAKEFAAMKYPVAVAVLPHLEYTKQTAQIAKKAGKVVFLHFPMAPKSYPNTDPGKGAVIPSMPAILISGVVKENFESLGVKADGFNNHMGSAITEDEVKMKHILEESSKYTSRYVDSRTTAQTVAYRECKKNGKFKCGENRIFIDNDNHIEAILAKIYEAADKARREGSLIAIGHIRQNTIQALKIALPELEKRNYKLVSVTELTK